MAKSHKSRFKQAWQKCKRYQVHRLGENNNMAGISHQEAMFRARYHMLQEYIMAKQGMA